MFLNIVKIELHFYLMRFTHATYKNKRKTRNESFLVLLSFVFVFSIQNGTVSSLAYAATYDIRDFGASSDSATPCTKAINQTIEKCAQNGGGMVVIPAGKYISGTILMKDNVELHLESGAYLYGSSNAADFPQQPQPEYRSQKERGGWYALICAEKANNISITGNGTIDGSGKH